MKKLVMFFMSSIIFIFFLIPAPIYSTENKVCEENPEQVCKEYESFIALLFNEKPKKISTDLLYIGNLHKISDDGSPNDPFCDKFYEL